VVEAAGRGRENPVAQGAPGGVGTGPGPEAGRVSPVAEAALRLLRRRGVEVHTCTEVRRDRRDDLERCAEFIGSRWENVRDFCLRLKRAASRGGGVRMDLWAGASEREINDTVHLGWMLRKAGILAWFDYEDGVLQARPERSQEAVAFVLGEWLERYAGGLLLRSAAVSGWPADGMSLVRRVGVSLPNGADAELDVVLFCGGRLFWVECTTGDDYEDVARRILRARRWVLGPEDAGALVVVNSLLPQERVRVEQAAGCRVLHPDELYRVAQEFWRSARSPETKKRRRRKKRRS